LTITGLKTDTLTLFITAGGPFSIAFPPACVSEINTDVVITLAAGGAGVSGALNVIYQTIRTT